MATMRKFSALCVLLIVLISACSDPDEAPTPTVLAPTQVMPTDRPSIVGSPTMVPTATRAPEETAAVPPPITPVILPTETRISTDGATASPPPSPAPGGQVAPGRTGLRLRSQPTENSRILRNLQELTPVTIIGRTADNQWLSVITNAGDGGWVIASYIELSVDINTIPVIDASQQVAALPEIGAGGSGVAAQVIAEGDGLRLRALPSTNAAILTTLPELTPVDILGRTQDNAWLQVRTPNNSVGWVMSQYLQVGGSLDLVPIPAEASVPTPVSFSAPSVASVGSPISGITSNSTQIFRRGQSFGNRANVFSKVGDSITATGHFMYSFGWGRYNLHDYAYYQDVISYFSGTTARESNSFANGSLAAKPYWSSATVLDPASAEAGTCQPGEMPLVCEYRIVRPSVALIMIGTNDIGRSSPEQFQANLQTIVQISMDMGVIPVLSTLPPRPGNASETTLFNQIIISTAQGYDVPLWDLYTSMLKLPGNGLDPDGVHPSFVGGEYSNYDPSGDFTATNLQYGYPFRNLMGLQVLDAVWRQIIAPNAGGAVSVTGSNTDGLSGSYSAAAPSNNPGVVLPGTTCPGAPITRLAVGGTGRVTPGEANNFRAEPSRSSALIGKIPPGESFTILQGPSCSDNITYWQVNYNGTVGWTGEGTGNEYWLEPG
jgi:uncharacterized protein YraI